MFFFYFILYNFIQIIFFLNKWIKELSPSVHEETHGVDSRQQKLRHAAQDLCDCHLVTEQQVCEVRSLHLPVRIHMLLDLLHFLLHQILS